MCRHQRRIELALQIAKSNPSHQWKLAALFAAGGKILAVGQNSTYKNNNFPTRHAEINCVLPVRDRKGVLYVARWKRSGGAGCAKPCKLCHEFLLRYTSISEVYFTTGEDLTWQKYTLQRSLL